MSSNNQNINDYLGGIREGKEYISIYQTGNEKHSDTFSENINENDLLLNIIFQI